MYAGQKSDITGKIRVDIKGGATSSPARVRMTAHTSQYYLGMQSYGNLLGVNDVVYERKFKDYSSREQKVINTIRLFADQMEQTGLFEFKLHHAPVGDKRGLPNQAVKGIDSRLLKFLSRKLTELSLGKEAQLKKRATSLKDQLNDVKSKIKAYNKTKKTISRAVLKGAKRKVA